VCVNYFDGIESKIESESEAGESGGWAKVWRSIGSIARDGRARTGVPSVASSIGAILGGSSA
jgi:hypothetical protein